MNTSAAGGRLARQIGFILEIDQAKQIFRQNSLLDGSRAENDAEHSWHLALMEVVLAEYAREPVDLSRVVQMLLIHDIVEIDAGDTFVYDTAAHVDKEERELRAAERIFNLLPEDGARQMRALWDEFEARRTPEARFAAALDRLHPLLNNYHTAGGGWAKHGVSAGRVRARNSLIEEGAPELWQYASGLIEDALRQGFIDEAEETENSEEV